MAQIYLGIVGGLLVFLLQLIHLNIELNSRFVQKDNFFTDHGDIWAATQFDPTMPVYSGDTAYGGYYETLYTAGGNSGNPIPLSIRNPLGLINQKEDISNVNRFIGNAKLSYKAHFMPELKAVLNVGTDLVNSSGTVLIPETAASNFQNGGFQTQSQKTKRFIHFGELLKWKLKRKLIWLVQKVLETFLRLMNFM